MTLTTPEPAMMEYLKHNLENCVPEMANGFIISTIHGDFYISKEYAEPFRNLAYEVLQYQLNRHMTRSTDESANCILPSTIS